MFEKNIQSSEFSYKIRTTLHNKRHQLSQATNLFFKSSRFTCFGQCRIQAKRERTTTKHSIHDYASLNDSNAASKDTT